MKKRTVQTKEERRRQLLTAALQVFGQKGYHSAQISDIIANAGVARGTFYLYFEGKREIFDALMSELFEKVRGQVRNLPREAVQEIPKQLRGNIERIIRLFFAEPLLSRLLFSESVGLDQELDQRLRQFYDQILDYIRRGLRQGQEMGFVRDGDISIMAISLLGCFKEIFYQHILGKEISTPADVLASHVFDFVVSAIIKPGMYPV